MSRFHAGHDEDCALQPQELELVRGFNATKRAEQYSSGWRKRVLGVVDETKRAAFFFGRFAVALNGNTTKWADHN